MTGHHNKRGFSLIEAAVVLGVVGVVVGAIWYSAAKFYENYNVNKTVEGMILTANKFQNLISLAAAKQMWGYSHAMIPDSEIIKLDVFPKDWVRV